MLPVLDHYQSMTTLRMVMRTRQQESLHHRSTTVIDHHLLDHLPRTVIHRCLHLLVLLELHHLDQSPCLPTIGQAAPSPNHRLVEAILPHIADVVAPRLRETTRRVSSQVHHQVREAPTARLQLTVAVVDPRRATTAHHTTREDHHDATHQSDMDNSLEVEVEWGTRLP